LPSLSSPIGGGAERPIAVLLHRIPVVPRDPFDTQRSTRFYSHQHKLFMLRQLGLESRYQELIGSIENSAEGRGRKDASRCRLDADSQTHGRSICKLNLSGVRGRRFPVISQQDANVCHTLSARERQARDDLESTRIDDSRPMQDGEFVWLSTGHSNEEDQQGEPCSTIPAYDDSPGSCSHHGFVSSPDDTRGTRRSSCNLNRRQGGAFDARGVAKPELRGQDRPELIGPFDLAAQT